MYANWFIHQYDQALVALERLTSLDPDDAGHFLFKAVIQVCMGEDVERIQETLSEWSRCSTGDDNTMPLEWLAFFELFHSWNQSIDLDAWISAVKSDLQSDQNPHQYFFAGLLYQLKGDEDSSYLYIDSAHILIESRVAEARSDTTGRFEVLELNHDTYDLLALAYSQTNRHERAIEHAQLSMESMPVEACHW
jgi:tetratricopeptide (TPR) repeat protein